MHIKNLKTPQLHIEHFCARQGESWCILGKIDSGIDAFLQLLEEMVEPPRAEVLELPNDPVIISFASQQAIYENELRIDDSDFLDHPDPGTPAHAFLPPGSLNSPLIDDFDLRESLDSGYRQLSSGQSRKLMLLQAVLSGSSTIIMDSPYDGLDRKSCRELDQALNHLACSKRLLILLFLKNLEDVPQWCESLAVFENGRISEQGPLAEVYKRIGTADRHARLFSGLKDAQGDRRNDVQEGKELIRLKDGFAGYGDKILFSGLNLSVNSGDHTLITGPNGCGKSTLMHILTGDNPKCYANDLTLFGRRRGTGESIWELKKEIGIVSPDLHRNYRVPGNCLQVILSGLFDSIGLYTRPTAQQERLGRYWLKEIGMVNEAMTQFRRLPYGKQRLILIARGLIKSPLLLILDEPTQGLDSASRYALLDFLDNTGWQNSSTIIYVSHRQDEYRPFFKQHIELEKYHPL